MELRIARGGSFVPEGGFFELPGEHVQRYVWVNEFARGKRVLDAGCGYGYGSRYLSDSGASYVLGLDSDPDAIQFATMSYGHAGCEFRMCDVTRLDVAPASFDVVVSFEVIEHVADVDSYLRGISRALKLGGQYVLSTPNKHYTIFSYKNGKSPNPFHIKEFYPQELVDLIKMNFSIDGLYIQVDKTLSDAQIEEFHKSQAYAGNCSIPNSLRRITPFAVKNLWLRHKHLSEMKPDASLGRWNNFAIERVDEPGEITARYDTVLISCRKI